MKHNKADNLNGWLIVDKARDIGSTDVVRQTKKLMHANKNGHTGTLDPFATGVLPIAFGEATKLIPFITDGNKEYEFLLKWGEATLTDDTEGDIIEQSDKVPSHDEIISAIPNFVGKVEQIPPAYSAIKINGQPAYKMARKGQEVDIPSREIEIYNLELLEEFSDSAKFRVECSKGTYVRTLGRDLARYLGTVGHLLELRRTKCGIFSLKNTILLEKLEKIEYLEERRKFLLPIETSLCDITEIAVSEDDATKLRHGQSISPKNYDVIASENMVIAKYNDCLVALVRVEKERISPVRVFNLI